MIASIVGFFKWWRWPYYNYATAPKWTFKFQNWYWKFRQSFNDNNYTGEELEQLHDDYGQYCVDVSKGHCAPDEDFEAHYTYITERSKS